MKNITLTVNFIRSMVKRGGMIPIFLLSFLASYQAKAQSCICPVNSIVINTGYNPATGGTFADHIQDPNWRITWLSPDCSTLPSPWTPPVSMPYQAFVVPAQSGWAPVTATSKWLNFIDFNAYTTDAIPPPVDPLAQYGKYVARFSRFFYLCSDDVVTINISSLAFDNAILSLQVDNAGTSYYTNITNTSAGWNPGLVIAPPIPSVALTAGWHTLDFTVSNWAASQPGNGHGLIVRGTISTTNKSIDPEVPQTLPVAGTISGPNPVCVGATCTYTNIGGTSGGTWSSSVGVMDPTTGVVTFPNVTTQTTATITYTKTSPPCPAAVATMVVTLNQPRLCQSAIFQLKFVGVPQLPCPA